MKINEVKPCDLVLVKGKGLISEAIEEVENSIYSHSAGIVKANEIVEAQGFQKTNYEGLDKYQGQADIFTCDILTDEQRNKIIEYVEKQVGTRYDYLLLFLEFLRYAFHLMLPYKEYHSYICSTLWADAYRATGIDLCSGIKYPSPKDLAESKLLRKVGSI